jgi:hypothetical protein
MSRSRATAVFAALVTMMAMMTGAVTLTSGAASATPPPSYTPVAPVFRVNATSVQLNSSLRATGIKYAPQELVYLTITYPAVGARPGFVKTIRVNTTRGQSFAVSIKLISTGQVKIRARGATSNRAKNVTVLVTAPRRRGR